MDFVLGACIDHGSADAADKLVLKAAREPRSSTSMQRREARAYWKACGSSVVSVFTSPINYVSVIQRLGAHVTRFSKMARPHPVVTRRY